MGRRLGIIAAALLLACSFAHAENVTVGVFAPSAPFPSTTARVDLASRLGDHLGKALGGTGTGRVYARAGDFGAAVKSGEIKIALVDAAYLSGQGGYTVIAGAVLRGGETTQGWQLIAKSGKTIGDLKGKKLIVPTNGGRETDFVMNVMLGGEVARDHFSKIEAAPDTASALAALGLGRADVAVVPVGVDLPAGASTIFTLPAIAGPVLVTYGGVSAAQRQTLATAAAGFKGDGIVGGFRGDGDGVRAIARRYGVAIKRGVLAVPAVRLVVGDLVEGRSFTIERTPPVTFTLAPR
ncbi:MAG: hypothetical protein H0V17_24760 [Deltaproteobacteria bacterium]|nr:hypothetical protein [Deltaproteobacteria bacterium]